MGITFARKLILMAPLTEAANIIDSGETSNGEWESQNQQIEVPVAFDDNWEPIKYMNIHESIDSEGVLYSNQLVCFWMDSPKRLVVS
jgi:hypothetical protein